MKSKYSLAFASVAAPGQLSYGSLDSDGPNDDMEELVAFCM